LETKKHQRNSDWCALNPLQFIEVICKQLNRKLAFSNMLAIASFRLESYIHLTNFINKLYKELQENLLNDSQTVLFPT
jgi:hypothetical protein